MSRFIWHPSPFALLVLASAFWGVATVISKSLLATVPPITLLVVQLAPSVALLWVLVCAHGIPLPPVRALLPLALLGVLNPGLSYTLSLLGLRSTSASVSTLLWAAEPVLIVVLAWSFLHELLTRRLLVLIGVAACGVILVSGLSEQAGGVKSGGYGSALILAGVLCCASYTISARRIASTVDALFTVALQQSVGLAWAVAIWPLEFSGNSGNPLSALTSRSLVWAAISGAMYYALAFWCYLRGLSQVHASTAGAFLNLIPVFGVSTAYAFLNERLTSIQGLGALAILASVSVLLISGSEPRPIAAPD